MANTRWRVRLDEPYQFSIEPGRSDARHCHDMRPSLSGDLFQCPVTKLIMLRPSFLSEAWYGEDNWTDLGEWAYDASFWQQVYPDYDPDVATDLAKHFTTVANMTTGSTDLIGITTSIAIGGISLASALTSDLLVWALESDFTLGTDEGFVWAYRAITGKGKRYKNWFALQWDKLILRFSFDGYCYPLWFESGDLEDTPEELPSFQVADAGDLADEDGYFSFIPIPGYGLAIYSSKTAQRVNATSSSADLAAARGHLLNLPVYNGAGGVADTYMLSASKVRVAVGSSLLRSQHKFGFHKITYPAVATYLDNITDPGFFPTNDPSQVDVSPVYTSALYAGDVFFDAAFRKVDDSGAWTAGTDRQGRIKVTLSSNDTRYTPFLLGTYVRWEPVFSLRDTTPVTPRLLELEFSDDEMGRFEGQARLLADTAAEQAVFERGDASFVLEKSFDEGETWETHAGGLARIRGDVEVFGEPGRFSYTATWQMADMRARFREVNFISGGAFEGFTLARCVSDVLMSSGLSALDSYPAYLDTLRIPSLPEGETWRFSPNRGDTGEEAIEQFLLLARYQWTEYRLRHDWDADSWTVEEKPGDASPMDLNDVWTFTPFSDEVPGGLLADETGRVVRIGDGPQPFTFAVMPPECNVLQLMGASSTNKNKGELIPSTPVVNVDSVQTPTSPDYLGRVITARPVLPSLQALSDVNKMARTFYDSAMRRRVKAQAIGHEYVDSLTCPARVVLRTEEAGGGGVASDWARLWLKQRVVRYDFQNNGADGPPRVTYLLDSRWESEIR